MTKRSRSDSDSDTTAAFDKTTSSPASSRPSSPDSTPVKRLKSSIQGVAEEFVCPLTLELPLNPVIAADGKLYDRDAIQEVIRRQGSAFRSPVTNQPMAPTLLPARQARNAIERLISTGAVRGDLAERWVRHHRDLNDAQLIKRRAEEGDVPSMRILAGLYHHGERGIELNVDLSAKWFAKAAEAGDACAMVMLGLFHVVGEVVDKNETYGVSLVSTAAGMGSDFAALYMSKWYAAGDHGLPRDINKAKYWSGKVLDGSCTIKDLTADSLKEAEVQLRELHEEHEDDEEDTDMDTSDH
mmetsp:Transcript_13012/g.27561  ORF Transcript_13012/g.27561 Transcript_13012/m.27561 type:complete len:298 (-) Transcript_13012:991-1884(-)